MLVEETKTMNVENKRSQPEIETIKFEKENTETFWLKKYHRPDWQNRSPIKDVFCRYGSYYS